MTAPNLPEQTSQPRAIDRQRRILDAALAVFTRRGFKEASVDEIAAEAQTSKGGVYFHFPGKQMLFGALLELSSRRLLERVEAAIARENDPVARADAALKTVLGAFAEHRSLAQLFMIEALGAGAEFQERLLAMHDEFIELIRRHLDDAMAAGIVAADVDTGIASRAWFGALNEVILHWLLKGEPERLEDAYAVLRPLLMRSVGVREGDVAIEQAGKLAIARAGWE
jgi:AcrR family transcriptional regulator